MFGNISQWSNSKEKNIGITEAYLKEQGVEVLLLNLLSAVLYEQPENPKIYILSLLERKKTKCNQSNQITENNQTFLTIPNVSETINTTSKQNIQSEDSKLNHSSSSKSDYLDIQSPRSQPVSRSTSVNFDDSPQKSKNDPLSEEEYQINQYILLSTIGKGSYGTVKLAKDKNKQQMRAIKIMEKEKLKRIRKLKPGQITNAFQDVLIEIAIMKKLDHPNVVKLFEVIDETETGFMYMVLEYAVNGQVLTLQEGKTIPLDENTAWKYFRDLINGIDYLHVQNIVHRDIKPENLLVFDGGNLKICDFGVAQVLDNSRQSITSTKGSPAFLAPEIFSMKTFKGKPVDIWAAGVTLYCFVFGYVPFSGNNFFELNRNINTQELKFDANKIIVPELKDLLSRLLEKDPEKRITIPEIKNHSWVTKNGQYPLNQQHEEVWVNEEEIRSAISNVANLADMVRRAKTFAKKLHKTVDSRNLSMNEDLLKKKVSSWKKTKLPRVLQVNGLFKLNARIT